MQEILLNVVLLKGDCKVIRAFLDGLLGNTKPTKEALREYGEKLDGESYKKQVHAPLEVAKAAFIKQRRKETFILLDF